MIRRLHRMVLAAVLILIGGLNASAADVLPLTSSTPENGGILKKANPFAVTINVQIELTFEEDVIIVKEKPEVTLNKSYRNGELILPDGYSWTVKAKSNDGKTVLLRLEDKNGYIYALSKAEDQRYFLSIPAGIVKNEDGSKESEAIDILFYDSSKAQQEANVIKPESYTPAEKDVLTQTAGKANARITLQFDTEVEIVESAPAAALHIGTADGESIAASAWRAQVSTDRKSVIIEAVDADGNTVTFEPEDKSYYFTLPEGIVKDAENRTSPALTIQVYGTEQAQNNAKPTVASTVPDGRIVPGEDGKAEVRFDIIFKNEINNIAPYAAIKFLVGSATGTSVQMEGGGSWPSWSIINNADYKTITIGFGDSWDDEWAKFTPTAGTTYCLIIPANTVTSADGIANDELVITFIGTESTSVSAIKKGKTVQESYTLDGKRTSTNQKGVNIVRFSDGTVKKVVTR